MPKPTDYVKTLDELSARLGTSTSTLIAWRHKGAPIKKTRRGYHVEKIRKWIEKHRAPIGKGRTRAKSGGEALERRKLEAEILDRESKAEMSRLKLEERRGTLVRKDVVREVYAEEIARIKSALMAQCRRWGLELSGLEAKEVEAGLKEGIASLFERIGGIE